MNLVQWLNNVVALSQNWMLQRNLTVIVNTSKISPGLEYKNSEFCSRTTSCSGEIHVAKSSGRIKDLEQKSQNLVVENMMQNSGAVIERINSRIHLSKDIQPNPGCRRTNCKQVVENDSGCQGQILNTAGVILQSGTN